MTNLRANLIQLVILFFLGMAALAVIYYNLVIFGKGPAFPTPTAVQITIPNPAPAANLTIYPTVGLTPYASRTPRIRSLIPRLFITVPATVTGQPTLSQSTFLPISTSSKLSIGPCSCQADTLDCTYADFSTLAEAQACYDYCVGAVGYDVHNLDQNFDGIACEAGLH